MKSLQSLRFIFALMIFFHHIPGSTGNGLFAAGGSCSVSFFFILSGFVLAMVYGDKVLSGDVNYSRFLVKRLSKIYPIHLFCLIVWLIIKSINNMSFFCMDKICHLIPNFLLLQSWIPDRGVYFSGNALSWFLSDMLFFYLMFPFVMHAIFAVNGQNNKLGRIGNKCIGLKYMFNSINTPFVVFLILLYGVVLYFVNKDLVHPLLYINPFFRIYDFILGIILYSLYRYISNVCGKKIIAASVFFKTLIELFVISLLVVQIVIYKYIPDRLGMASYWWLVMAVMILLISLFDTFGGGIITKILKNKYLVILGDFSFCMYMVHGLVISVVGNLELGWAVQMVISLIISVLLGYLLHNFLEKPISTLVVKRYEKKCV